MNFEDPTTSSQEIIPPPNVNIEPEFVGFAPQEFLSDPAGYFELEGRNIKTGDIKVDEFGAVREDPTAVKDLPIWKNKEGQELATVGRRINIAKGKVGESGDPFYEYKVLEKLQKIGLPAARPVAKAEQGDLYVMVMERIPGIRWSEREALQLRGKGYSEADIENLKAEAQQKMEDLQTRFEQEGVIRGWKLKDMVFQIDIENKKIINIVPTDWERTKIIEKPEKQ